MLFDVAQIFSPCSLWLILLDSNHFCHSEHAQTGKFYAHFGKRKTLPHLPSGDGFPTPARFTTRKSRRLFDFDVVGCCYERASFHIQKPSCGTLGQFHFRYPQAIALAQISGGFDPLPRASEAGVGRRNQHGGFQWLG